MSDDTRNGTTQVHPPTAGDAAQLLAAVKDLLPPPAAEELRRWERGEQSTVTTIERVRELPPSPIHPPSPDELLGRLVELESQYPPPDREAILADCRWLQSHWIDDELAPYRGTSVVVYNGAVVGAADDPLSLKLDLAQKFGVHPQRFVIEYIPREWGF